jgi:hypothetical protein
VFGKIFTVNVAFSLQCTRTPAAAGCRAGVLPLLLLRLLLHH